MKVRVEQEDGEVCITKAGDIKNWSVKDHLVTVFQADLALFLELVPGSEAEAETRPKTVKDDK